jgi:DNA-binding transcriptional regulator YiaG
MRLKYKGKIHKMLHEDAMGHFEVGAISEERMREWDNKCLVQDEPAAPKVRKSRPARTKRAAALAD